MAKKGGRTGNTKSRSGSTATSAPPSADAHPPRTHGERQERKQRVLTHGTSSITPSISAALLAKSSDLFFLCNRDGRVPMDGTHGITWERVVDGETLVLHDRLSFENYGRERAEFPISLSMRSRFQDIFIVRGMLAKKTGSAEPPAWRDGALQLVYRGEDSLYRSTTVYFEPEPRESRDDTATFQVELKPREAWVLDVFIQLRESAKRGDVVRFDRPRHPDGDGITQSLHKTEKRWFSRHTRIESDSLVLRRLVKRSLRDLNMLRTCLDDDEFFAAGVPWFVTLFGRDSVVTSLQTLMFDRGIAEQMLRVLAEYQRFQRTSHGVAVDVLSVDGELSVLVEPDESRQPA
jgi:glycogen debranching enzyme